MFENPNLKVKHEIIKKIKISFHSLLNLIFDDFIPNLKNLYKYGFNLNL